MNSRPLPEQLEAAEQLGQAILRFVLALQEARRPEAPIAVPRPELLRSDAKDASSQRLLLKPREAAQALGVSSGTLWNLTQPRGPIPAIHVGRLVRYPTEALEAWIASQATRQP